ncbi:hypothetical protein FRC07_006160, partial [Ceratobasidium sp. 392]
PNPPRVGDILALLAQRCPGIEILELGLGFDPPTNTLDEGMMQMIYLPIACGHLRSLQDLTSLEVGGDFITSESFFAISHLPKLRDLKIHTGSDEIGREVFRTAQLSDDSFPVLVSLLLSSHCLDLFLLAWECILLVQKLQIAELSLWPYEEEPISTSEEIALGRLWPRIWKLSPHVLKLHLKGPGWAELLTKASLIPWHALTQLPICYLSFKVYDFNVRFTRETFPVLPFLETLELPYYHFTLEHLAHLGQVTPRLQRLICNFVDGLDAIPEVRYPCTAPLRIIELRGALPNEVRIQTPDEVARFLLSIYPELQGIEYMSESKKNQPRLELLNLQLQVASGARKTK